MNSVHGFTATTEPAGTLAISGLRAQNVANFLVNIFGIACPRVSAEGFSETRRFAYNTTAEGRQENRRVNIIFNYAR